MEVYNYNVLTFIYIFIYLNILTQDKTYRKITVLQCCPVITV